MGWDERLFGALWRWRRRPAELRGTASLAPRRAELGLLASAIAGRLVTLGNQWSASSIGVPESLALGGKRETSEEAWLHRIAWDATVLRLGLSAPRLNEPARSQATLLAMPTVIAAIDADLPAIAPLRERLFAEELRARGARVERLELFLRARLAEGEPISVASFGLLPGPLTEATVRVAAIHEDDGGGATGTERRAPTARAPKQVRRVELPEDKRGENPLVHSFEKVHTAEEYKGGRKSADAEDELAEHGEALDELTLEEVVRSRQRARSVYRADVALDVEVTELASAEASGIPYDEWDEGTRTYRRGWCSVFERIAPAADARVAAREAQAIVVRHAREVRALEAELARIERARAWRGRQPDGVDVDLEAIVERHAALVAGHAPPDKLYVTRPRRPPDVSVLLLVDVSLSTDAWVRGHRVLDVAKESLVVMAESLARARIDTSIAAFHSNTRRDCRYLVVKREAESWAHGIGRLLPLEPTGYTRVGPALRHATARLAATHHRRKLLLLLSDAKPTDHDRYEGRYGIADVRQAVREAHARGIEVFALTIDAAAGAHLPQLFGRGRYELLPNPSALPLSLGRVFLELLR